MATPNGSNRDILMADASDLQTAAAAAQAPPEDPTNGNTANGTPSRTAEPANSGSRATSQLPDFVPPANAAPHGTHVRQYLNEKASPVVLEGMKMLAREKPAFALKALADFFAEKSLEIEGPDAKN